MNAIGFFVCGVLPYFAILVFVTGMTYRFYVWFKTPQPAKLTLFPAGGSTFKEVLKETLVFPSLFRGDKVLWSFAWLFHAALALAVLGHVRVFTGLLDSLLLAMGMSPEGVDWMSSTFGLAAGVVLLSTGVLLLIRRMAIQRVREISNVSDFFALLLLVAIITTGDLMRLGAHFDLEQTRVWAWSLVSFSPVVIAHPVFLVHMTLALLLFMYIPFSKIMHFGGIFFTHALIKRR